MHRTTQMLVLISPPACDDYIASTETKDEGPNPYMINHQRTISIVATI